MFLSLDHAFESKNYHLALDLDFLVSFSKTSIILCFILKSVICFELIFGSAMRFTLGLIFFYNGCPIAPAAPFVEKLSSAILLLCQKSVGRICVHLF